MLQLAGIGLPFLWACSITGGRWRRHIDIDPRPATRRWTILAWCRFTREERRTVLILCGIGLLRGSKIAAWATLIVHWPFW